MEKKQERRSLAQALNEAQLDFLRKRRQLMNFWRFVGPLLLLGIGSFTVFVWFRSPYLIDPRKTAAALEKGTLSEGLVEFMALLLPVVLLMLCALTVVLILLAFAAVHNEKKYLKIVEQLRNTSRHPDCSE